MSNASTEFRPAIVGERLRLARENAGLTQAQAASKLNVARTTIVAMEQGLRRTKTEELRSFARLYKTSVNAFLRTEAVFVDIAPRFRRFRSKSNDVIEDAARLLSQLAQAEVELENLLGVIRTRNYPPERPLLPGDIRRQAEEDATELRQRLGLGHAPVHDIFALLEVEMGVRVYVRPLDSKISGLFAYDDAVGACILINRNHPRERRVQTAAHELGHLVSSRRDAEVLEIDEDLSPREEKYADTFGRTFLTPARALTERFKEITAGSSSLTRRHIIILAHIFGVSREAIVRRLEELKLTKVGTWDWFEDNGGITDAQARQVLGDRIVLNAGTEVKSPTSLRLALLANEAWRRELLSEGQLAQLLQLGRIELREILDSFDMDPDDGQRAIQAN
jgi:Zn-dependent peptidase ImmA (M78 family)/DNA-binding XRE family transcriptional regulator